MCISSGSHSIRNSRSRASADGSLARNWTSRLLGLRSRRAANDVAALYVGLGLTQSQGSVQVAEFFHFDLVVASYVDAAEEGNGGGHKDQDSPQTPLPNGRGSEPRASASGISTLGPVAAMRRCDALDALKSNLLEPDFFWADFNRPPAASGARARRASPLQGCGVGAGRARPAEERIRRSQSYASASRQNSTQRAISFIWSEPSGTLYSNSMVPWNGYFSFFINWSTSLTGVSPWPQTTFGPLSVLRSFR